MSLLLIGTGKLSPACVAGKRFLPRVRSNVGREMIGTRETPHADPALERFLTRVDTNVSRQLVRTGEATVTPFHGASVGALMNGRLRGPVGIATPLYWNKP